MVPFETLYWAHAGAGGVAVNDRGKMETLITPLQLNTDNTVVRVGSLNISSQGVVSGTLKVGFTGAQALEWRLMALRTDAGTVNQRLEKTIAAQVPDGIQAHVTSVAGLDDPNRQLVAVVQVKGSIADQSGKHLVLPRLFFDSKETNPFPALATRTLPVDMQYPAQEKREDHLRVPKRVCTGRHATGREFQMGRQRGLPAALKNRCRLHHHRPPAGARIYAARSGGLWQASGLLPEGHFFR